MIMKKISAVIIALTAALLFSSCDLLGDYSPFKDSDSKAEESSAAKKVVTQEKIIGSITDFGQKSMYTTSITSLTFSNADWRSSTMGDTKELILEYVNNDQLPLSMFAFSFKDPNAQKKNLKEYAEYLHKINLFIKQIDIKAQAKKKVAGLDCYVIKGNFNSNGVTLLTKVYIFKKKDMVGGVGFHTLPEYEKQAAAKASTVIKTFKFTDENIVKK